jgi:uncharacterized MnhB-related membrane protein
VEKLNMTHNITISSVIGLFELPNTMTGGIFYIIITAVLGFTVFFTLKQNDINNSFILSTFLSAILGLGFFLAGLLDAYAFGLFVTLFFLSLLFKILLKEG